MNLLCADFDGTFNRNSFNIKNQMIKKIEKVMKFRDQGNLFGIATGRDCTQIEKFCERYNLICDFIIGNNGAEIVYKNDLIYTKYIQNNIVKTITKEIKKMEYLFFAVMTNEGIRIDLNYKNIIKNVKLEYFKKLYGNSSYLFKRIKNINNINQIIIMFPQDKINQSLENIQEILPKDLRAVFNEELLIGIINNECNKAKGINMILEKNNIKKENVYTIGNYYNDYEMLKEFNGFAVPSAPKCIKDISKEVVSIEEVIDLILL